MRRHQVLSVFAVVLCGSLVAAQGIQSGPKAGTNIPGPFHPVIVVHAEMPDHAGKRWDFTEQYGARSYVLIFARTASEPLAGLLAKVDAALAKQRDAKDKKDAWSAAVYGVVILLSDQDGLDKQLSKLAKQLKVKHLSLAIDNPAGPRAYRLDKEADITVLLVSRRKVEANHAFKKDELRDMNVKQIVSDLQETIEKARHAP